MSVNALIFTELQHPVVNFSRTSGAYRIATEIRKAGYTCQVVDFFSKFSDDEMKRITDEMIGDDTLIIGVSTTFLEPNNPERLNASGEPGYPTNMFTELNLRNKAFHIWLDRLQTEWPKLKVVIGGAFSHRYKELGDALVYGSGDSVIVSYMRFMQGTNPFLQFEKLDDTTIVLDGTTHPFNFSESTIEWHPSDHLQHAEVLPIELSRGCIFKCSFCAFPLNGKKKLDYLKSDSVLRDEFIRNYYEYGVTRYMYNDDTHNESIEKIERIHRVVTSLPFEIEYASYIRLDLLHAHKETASLLRESGLRAALFGIESLNYESAKAIGKGMHPEKVKEMLYWLREDVWKDEVSTTGAFIVGLPHDSEDTINSWIEWVLDPACPLHVVVISPLTLERDNVYQSDFITNAEKHGYVLHGNNNWSNEFFTADSARQLTAALNEKRIRAGYGAFPLIGLANLGYEPRDLIPRRLTGDDLEQIRIRRLLYINGYKERLLSSLPKSS